MNKHQRTWRYFQEEKKNDKKAQYIVYFLIAWVVVDIIINLVSLC